MAVTKQPVNNDKDDNGAEAAAAKFLCTITSYQGSQPIGHKIEFAGNNKNLCHCCAANSSAVLQIQVNTSLAEQKRK